MPLTDTFVKQYKHSGKPAGDKHSDGGGLYLHTTAVGKYWRLAYRFAGKQKTLALGVYPSVTLAQARRRRDEAKAQLADGTDPSVTKREEKLVQKAVAGNTFEKVAEQWLKATEADRKEITLMPSQAQPSAPKAVRGWRLGSASCSGIATPVQTAVLCDKITMWITACHWSKAAQTTIATCNCCAQGLGAATARKRQGKPENGQHGDGDRGGMKSLESGDAGIPAASHAQKIFPF